MTVFYKYIVTIVMLISVVTFKSHSVETNVLSKLRLIKIITSVVIIIDVILIISLMSPLFQVYRVTVPATMCQCVVSAGGPTPTCV